MSKSDTASKESAGHSSTGASHISSLEPQLGHRPAYFVLGRTRDCDYVADLRTRTVHVVSDNGGRAHRYHLNGKTLDEFVSAVDEAYGWDELLYGGGIAGVIERSDFGV